MKKFEMSWIRRWSLVEHFIETYKMKRIIEIGVYNCELSKKVLRNTNFNLELYVMIDNKMLNICKILKEQYKCIKLMSMESKKAVSMLDDDSYDLIFVDGCHTYDGCKADIIDYKPKLKKGGFMLVHDCDRRVNSGTFPGILQAVNELWGEDWEFMPDECPNSARGIAIKRF